MAYKYHQGIFKPKFPAKYKGNPKSIFFRSGLEKRFFLEFDENPQILFWASEEMFVLYVSPKDNKVHRYFVDCIIETKDGKIMIEIKPYSQCYRPKATKNTKKLITETIAYEVNQAKWKAAEAFCKEHKMKFMVCTEKDLKVIKK